MDCRGGAAEVTAPAFSFLSDLSTKDRIGNQVDKGLDLVGLSFQGRRQTVTSEKPRSTDGIIRRTLSGVG